MLDNDRSLWPRTRIPRSPPPANLPNIAKVRHVEKAFKEDICGEIPDLRPDARFIPYLQLHEYEAILFSDPITFAIGINHPNLQHQFQRIRDEFESPEDINDNPDTAPSKRLLAACPTYRKVIEGTQAAAAIGIPRMRQECRHFCDWMDVLESLSDK